MEMQNCVLEKNVGLELNGFAGAWILILLPSKYGREQITSFLNGLVIYDAPNTWHL